MTSNSYLPLTSSQILETATDALETEITELQNLRHRLGVEFVHAAEAIFSAKGKLIVVGIGKSAHVAGKIVATLNSTGTPSQFLHASEAIHGDLGVIQPQDVVLCISYSGNSPEIISLLPFLKEYSATLIGMTGNLNSKLADASDIVLNTHVTKEACRNQLAPTSSTTVQMALGDALAVALMTMNGFKDTDFAKFHPGGSLGKNLTAKVEQFVSEQKPVVAPTAGIKEVIIAVSASRHGITVVANGEEILGVITDGDLRRMLMNTDDISKITAEDIMSRHPKTLDKKAFAREAMALLKENNIGQLIVTDEGSYFGIIDLHRLLDEGIA